MINNLSDAVQISKVLKLEDLNVYKLYSEQLADFLK